MCLEYVTVTFPPHVFMCEHPVLGIYAFINLINDMASDKENDQIIPILDYQYNPRWHKMDIVYRGRSQISTKNRYALFYTFSFSSKTLHFDVILGMPDSDCGRIINY